jgi:hypothetical protein
MDNILDPIAVFEQIGCKYNEAIWDTPFSKIPVIGLKSSLNPLGKQFRQACGLGEFKGKPKISFLTKFEPMSPINGPPLPRILNIKWPLM